MGFIEESSHPGGWCGVGFIDASSHPGGMWVLLRRVLIQGVCGFY